MKAATNQSINMKSLLTTLMKANQKSIGQNYVVNPLFYQFRCSQIPYCQRKHAFNNLPEIFTTLIDLFEYEIIEVAEDIPKNFAALQKKADSGTLVHELVQMILKGNSDYTIIHEDPIFWQDNRHHPEDEAISLFGHVDTQIFDNSSNLLILLDEKTVDTFRWLDKDGHAKEGHIEQLNLYFNYLKRKYPAKNIVAYIWYLLRTTYNEFTGNMIDLIDLLMDSDNWRLFEVRYDKELYDDSINKCFSISHELKSLRLPPITTEAWQCKSRKYICPFHPICHEYNVTTLEQLAQLLLERK